MTLTVGSLFSGIGGFDLGLERAGMRVLWHSEIDPYASAVLKKHWPEVPNLGDIRTITAARLRAYDRERAAAATVADANSGRRDGTNLKPEVEPAKHVAEVRRSTVFPDVLCGGFPCQDISNAGKRSGIDGERSGLWSEYARVIGELRPRYVIVENVAALLGRGIERVLGDLAALGFDAEWHCIPASAVGAPHRRDRVWIVAYAAGADAWRRAELPKGAEPADRLAALVLPDSRSNGGTDIAGGDHAHVADANGREPGRRELAQRLADRPDTDVAGHGPQGSAGRGRRAEPALGVLADELSAGLVRRGDGWWDQEPQGVPRVASNVPHRVDQLRCLGNALVPAIAEIIGRAVIATHHQGAKQ